MRSKIVVRVRPYGVGTARSAGKSGKSGTCSSSGKSGSCGKSAGASGKSR